MQRSQTQHLTKNTQRKNTHQTPSKLHHSTSVQTSQTHGLCNKSKHKIPKSHSNQKQHRTHTKHKRKTHPHNSVLASFDITNFYTNIPTFETLQIQANMLKQNNTPQAHIDEIIKITAIITQPEGLPIC